MKSNTVLITGLAAIIGTTACSANAQSTVTLYGVIDVGIDFVNNSDGKKAWAMKDGTYTGVYGSRWGLLGTEDLGGGFSAVFRIENGFNLPNGTLAQGGLEFGRQAYVGLSSKKYGTVTLGRQYDSVVDFLQFAGSSSQMGTFAAHPEDVDNLVNSFRVNNSIKYFSPTLNGFRFSSLFSLRSSQVDGGPRQLPF
jgi:predicted porin